jgi:phosphoserine phosphatase RsbU/P
MNINLSKYHKAAGRVNKNIKRQWSVRRITLHEKHEHHLTLLFDSDVNPSKFSEIKLEDDFAEIILFKDSEYKDSGIKRLFNHFSPDVLFSFQAQGNRKFIVTLSWPEVLQHKNAIEIIRQLLRQMCNQLFLEERLKMETQRTEQIISEVGVLHEISRAFDGSKSLENLLTYILEKARQLIRTESASVMLYIEETKDLEFKVVLGPKATEVKPFRLPMGQGISGWVAQHRKPILIPDAYEDPRFDPSFDKRSGYRTRSILCVPMLHKKKLIGVMTVLNRVDNLPFMEEDKNIMLTFASQAALAIENSRLLLAAIEKERLDKELQVASQIQNLLIPQSIPKVTGLEIDATYLPCKEVSGDFYDIIKLNNDKFAFVVADVAGKGIPGAMLVSTMQARLSAYLEDNQDLVQIVDRLNRNLIKNTTDDRFITFFICIYNPQDASLVYLNGGHNPPFLLNNGFVKPLTVGGIFIGSMPWDYESETLHLKKEDILILYTDGLVEAMNEKKEEFGDERLIKILTQNKSKSPQQILKKITASVDKHTKNEKLEDDFTLVVIKKTV